MLLKNTNKKQHAIYNAGFEMRIPRGKTVDIPGRYAEAFMRRWPCLVPVDENRKVIGTPEPTHNYPTKKTSSKKKDEAPTATVIVTATSDANSEEA